MKRREFLTATATTAGALLAGLPSGWMGSVYADDSPETSTVRFGVIALTDCAPIVMAHELGYFKKFGITTLTFTDTRLEDIEDAFSDIKEYLAPPKKKRVPLPQITAAIARYKFDVPKKIDLTE